MTAMRGGLGLAVSVAEHLVVVIATASLGFVVDVLDNCVFVVVVVDFVGHVDDDLLVTAAVSARRYQ